MSDLEKTKGKKSVGIITFHNVYNFGAILQAYALRHTIEEGFQDVTRCEVIDYINPLKAKEHQLFYYDKKMGLKNNAKKFIKDIYRIHKNKRFDRFARENITLSDKYESIESLVEMDRTGGYDVYIVGSDQVWNTGNNKKDTAYLLSFVGEDKKRASYAASFGACILGDEETKIYKYHLSKFDVITVRERSALENQPFLKQLNARVVVDPTLLLSKKEYQNLMSDRIVKSRYAFLYTIEEERHLRKYAIDYCKKNGLILIDSKRSIEFFLNSGPEDFLSFIYYADVVFTNSFHGTVFSLILNKQFATEVNTNGSVNTRSKDLLDEFDLIDRDIDSSEHDITKQINQENTNAILARLKRNSLGVLRQIVE